MTEPRIGIRNRTINGVRTAVEVDLSRYHDREGMIPKRKYIKGRQCATVFKTGRSIGRRCSWYAVEGNIHCKRHCGNPNPSNYNDARAEGHRNWWKRLHALEAAHPGALRRILNNDKAHETRRRNKEIEATLLPRPKTDDKVIMQAHKALVKQAAALPPIPDKPFDALAPHEQLVFNTRLALKRSHEILEIRLTEKKMTDNPKLAAMIKDAAFRTLATSVRVDSNTLQARKIDRMGELLQRLKAGDEAKVIDG